VVGLNTRATPSSLQPDSRIDTTRKIDAIPGEVFSSGISPTRAPLTKAFPDQHHHSTSAAIEYAVRVLGRLVCRMGDAAWWIWCL
jgi:hypothetical protein